MQRTLLRWLVCAFFVAFLALGLCTAADYGPPWDEPDEMDILEMNVWEYVRALHLDESVFEAHAAGERALRLNALTPISKSIEQDHGIAAFYPMAGVVMSDAITEGQRSTLWHMYCWVIFTLGAFALYAVCRELGLPRGWALLGPLFLLLSPRFFAQGHYNNKDVALLALALCVLWQALRLMRRPSFPRGLCFSFFGALAANTKVAGLALWGLCALFVLVRRLMGRRMNARVWAVAGVTLVGFLGFYALLTPALWANPAAFLAYLVRNALDFQRWRNYVLFRGTVFNLTRDSLPWYYLPYLILATTPLWALLLIAAGSAGAAACGVQRMKKAPDQALALLLTLVLWVLPLGFAVITRTSVYNGWRHFYFLYGPMLALAAWGAHAAWLRMRGRWRACAAAVLGCCLAASGVGIAVQHPNQFAYYQPLVRNEQSNELDYWNVSVRNALAALCSEASGEIRIAPADAWAGNGIRKALAVLPGETRSRFVVCEPQDADYLLVNPTYQRFSQAEVPDAQPIIALGSYGQTIMAIYEISPKEATAFEP